MSESIGGTIYPIKIPSYTEAADIQAALKLLHYGSTTVPTQLSDVDPNSVAGHLKAVNTRVDNVLATGIGSTYDSAMPSNPQDGFIWVDSDDVLETVPVTAAYQSTAPSSPAIGTLWVDTTSGENSLHLKVYNGTTWKVIV